MICSVNKNGGENTEQTMLSKTEQTVQPNSNRSPNTRFNSRTIGKELVLQLMKSHRGHQTTYLTVNAGKVDRESHSDGNIHSRRGRNWSKGFAGSNSKKEGGNLEFHDVLRFVVKYASLFTSKRKIDWYYENVSCYR
jgi:hypothetical protein